MKKRYTCLAALISGLLFILPVSGIGASPDDEGGNKSRNISFEPSVSGGYVFEFTSDIHPYWKVGIDAEYLIKKPISLSAGAGYSNYSFSYSTLTVNNLSGNVAPSTRDVKETKVDLFVAGRYFLLEGDRWTLKLDLGFRDLLLFNNFKDFNIAGPMAGIDIERYFSKVVSIQLKGNGAYDINKGVNNKITIGQESSILYKPLFLLDYLVTLNFKTNFGKLEAGYEGEMIGFTFINRFYHGLTIRLLF